MPTVTLRNSVDCWVSSDRAAKFGDTRLYVHSTANAYIYFSRPNFPSGTVITSATLRVWPGPTSGNSSVTVLLHRLTSAFDPNSTTWANLPTVGSQVASLTRTWYNSGAAMEFSITTDMQSIVDGSAWYGWRVSTTSTDTTQYLLGGMSDTPMELVINYQIPASTPEQLWPNGNVTVTDPKPTLAWVSNGGPTGGQLALQVQVASDSAFTTNLYTSDQIASSASSIDLDVATPAFTALTNGQSRYWRVRVKNDTNVWSAYSAAAQFTYSNAATLAITAPSGTTTSDPTPTISWTLTGATQQAWQILVYNYNLTQAQSEAQGNNRSPLLYDSGIQYGTTASMVLPVGVIRYENSQYVVELRSWPTSAVVSIAGAPAYITTNKNLTWVPTGAVPAVQLLVTQENPPMPARLIRWQYTNATFPRSFIVNRIRNGVVEVQWNVGAASVQEGATQWFRLVDRMLPGRANITYQVFTVWPSGAVSTTASSPTWTGKVDHLMPWCVSVTDPTKGFSILNPNVDASATEVSDVVRPVGAKPYLAIQSQGGVEGQMVGLISNEAWPGNSAYSAEEMRADFLFIKKNPRVWLSWQDQAVEAFVYEMDIQSVGVANGTTDYIASFKFVQV